MPKSKINYSSNGGGKMWKPQNNPAKLLLCVLFIFAFKNCYSSEVKLECSEPNGLRLWYFEYNKFNQENNKFITGDDNKVSGVTSILTLSENGATFVTGDTKKAGALANEYTAKLTLVSATEEQISLVGLLYGAPILVSYYPRTSVLIWSQHAIWPPDYAKGSKISIFYTTCKQTGN